MQQSSLLNTEQETTEYFMVKFRDADVSNVHQNLSVQFSEEADTGFRGYIVALYGTDYQVNRQKVDGSYWP